MTDELVEKVTREIDKYHIGCNIKRECNSECGKCAAEAVIPIIRKAVEEEPWFNYEDSCADGFISTHEKATNEVRKAVADEIKREQMIAKAQLTLLVAEIQGCKNMKRVGEILKSWIDANDLEPEKVETYSSIEALSQALNGKTSGKDIEEE